MAQYSDSYRQAIQSQLDLLAKKKVENDMNLTLLQNENDVIAEEIELGQNTLEYLNTQLATPAPSTFEVTSSTTGTVNMTWEDLGPGYMYAVEKDLESDQFNNPNEIYRDIYTNTLTDTDEVSGTEIFYRVKALQEGKDDSAWVVGSVTVM